MSLHVIVGAGPVGTATAHLLAESGQQVRLLTRRGGGPRHPLIDPIAADASDAAVLTRHTAGAAVLYSCAGPAYHRWAQDWPPLGAALRAAARSTGAVLVTTGNLYGYGAVTAPMTEQTPLRPNSVKGRVRAQLWLDALADHEAGRLRTAEVRGSDYLGAGVASAFTAMVLPRVLAGRRAMIAGDPDAPHSWTYVGDVARTLLAVAADESAWGRPWHVPTPPPMTVRALAERVAEFADVAPARVSSLPGAALRLAGLFDPAARELIEVRYQMDHPFVLDSSAATAAFGIVATSTDDAVRETIAAAS
ncbi:NAD-dependent epimerase/dehydratase family protein [Nocardia neocaledoniensis]|uniref:NAD-dependent epimerase/dehydratase family protein n=1 Tax=Nocardia neocaledoniensis TaxID=236511 RepID=UPI002458B7B6|nr:NAD-dependent epimerase/dehydratase family protein [Nocardia neocaledoniensis]